MSEVEVPNDVCGMAECIYVFLKNRESNSYSWWGAGVIRSMMGISKENDILFTKGLWLLVIQGIMERNEKFEASNSFRLRE